MATSSIITFTGLLVFRRDPDTNTFEVGVLRATEAHHPHFLQIGITPPLNGSPGPTIEDLEEIIQQGHVRWTLEVDGGGSPMGVQAQPHKPGNRKVITSENRKDLGWIINLEGDEFHDEILDRKEDALKPVIRLVDGKLFTSCKPDLVDTFQDGDKREFGFIAGAISLEIDTSQGQQPVLSFADHEGKKIPIFRLVDTAQKSYVVTIENTQKGSSSSVGDHFHLYYDLLFDDVDEEDRFSFKVQLPPKSPANDRCPVDPPVYMDKEKESADPSSKLKAPPTPEPFRCGGILVSEQSGPL